MENVENSPVSESVDESGVENVGNVEEVVDNPVSDYMHKVKVDGKDIDVSIDDLQKSYEHSSASRKRFEEASLLRKEVDQFLDSMHNGELDSLLSIVPEEKLNDFAESVLRKKVEWDEKPEETKARVLAERERDDLKEKLDKYSQKEQEQIKLKVSEQSAVEIDTEISGVIEELEKTHGSVVRTPEFIQDIARVMLAQLDSGAESMSAKKAASMAYKSWKNRIGNYVKNVAHSDLEGFLSKKQVESLRKTQLDNAMSQFPKGSKSVGKSTSGKKSRVTVDNFFNGLDKQFV